MIKFEGVCFTRVNTKVLVGVVVVFLAAFGYVVYLANKTPEPEVCAVDGCENEPKPGSTYCYDHACFEPGCEEKRTSDSRYCRAHSEQYEAQKKKSYNTFKKSSSSSSSSSYKKKSSGSSSYVYDSYDVNSYKSKEEFAEDKYEEFYDYEDDYEDEDEAYDAAEDYWEDNYEGD